MNWYMCEESGRGAGRGKIPYQSTSKWLFGHEKQCQETVLNFICNTQRRKEKKVSSENEATLQVKVGGFF